jgi:hypothetical protein
LDPLHTGTRPAEPNLAPLSVCQFERKMRQEAEVQLGWKETLSFDPRSLGLEKSVPLRSKHQVGKTIMPAFGSVAESWKMNTGLTFSHITLLEVK